MPRYIPANPLLTEALGLSKYADIGVGAQPTILSGPLKHQITGLAPKLGAALQRSPLEINVNALTPGIRELGNIPKNVTGITMPMKGFRPEFRAAMNMPDIEIRLDPNLSQFSKYAPLNTPIHEGLHAAYYAKDPGSLGGPPAKYAERLFEYYNSKFPALQLSKLRALYERGGFPGVEAAQEAAVEGMTGNMIQRLAAQGLM